MAQSGYPEFENSPYTKLTGVEFIRLQDGYSHAIMKVTESVLGFPNGSVHGGAIATLVDVGMGGALRTLLKDDEHDENSTIAGQLFSSTAIWCSCLRVKSY